MWSEEDLGLPAGYYVRWDADVPTLRRANGSMVAAFSAAGMDPREVRKAAEEDAAEQEGER